MVHKEAKPCMITWILFLLEFDCEVKDQKGCKNQVTHYFPHLEKDHENHGEIKIGKFPNNLVMSISGMLHRCVVTMLIMW